MLGNFFMVTCPYLYELDTVTYFALLPDQPLRRGGRRDPQHHPAPGRRLPPPAHASTSTRSRWTARHSPTMYLPHVLRGGRACGRSPRARSSPRCSPTSPTGGSTRWRGSTCGTGAFQQAREVRDAVRAGTAAPGTRSATSSSPLLRMMLTRDERFAELAARHLDLADLLAIRRRMIGTGLVGGKAAGHAAGPRHPRERRARAGGGGSSRTTPGSSAPTSSTPTWSGTAAGGRGASSAAAAACLEGAAEARARILGGDLPRLHRCAVRRDARVLRPVADHRPLLEPARGRVRQRLHRQVRERLLREPGLARGAARGVPGRACATVYASTMSEEALRYRERRGLLDRDEQMAVLVQRVSGAVHGAPLLPAGRRASRSPTTRTSGTRGIDPQAGVVRLVFGLGTRAVDRSDDDYTRIVALNAPSLPPGVEPRRGDRVRAAPGRRARPRRRTALDLGPVRRGGARARRGCRCDLFGTRAARAAAGCSPSTSCSGARRSSSGMRELLAHARATPTATRWTSSSPANFLRRRRAPAQPGAVPAAAGARGRRDRGAARRPARGRGRSSRAAARSSGRARTRPIDRVVYVDPDAYARARHPGPPRGGARRRAARRASSPPGTRSILLLGPGRWGTTTVALGVPGLLRRDPAGLGALRDHEARRTSSPTCRSARTSSTTSSRRTCCTSRSTRRIPGTRLDEARLRAAPNRLPALLPDDARHGRGGAGDRLPARGRRPARSGSTRTASKQEVLCYLAPR